MRLIILILIFIFGCITKKINHDEKNINLKISKKVVNDNIENTVINQKYSQKIQKEKSKELNKINSVKDKNVKKLGFNFY
jgi:Na+-translocating ferredoxin:NAD+ oxidoreductase RnfG subunit